jgi:hypothetical protein
VGRLIGCPGCDADALAQGVLQFSDDLEADDGAGLMHGFDDRVRRLALGEIAPVRRVDEEVGVGADHSRS